MKRMLLIAALAAAPLLWQPTSAQDARGVIEAASKAMGTTGLQSIEYAAEKGNIHSVGQAPGPGKPWPRFTIVKHTAAINFAGPVMREETVRIDDENPPRGGGAGPYVAATQQGGIRPIPFGPQSATAVRDGRTENGAVQIWMTPHGFLKGAAAAANATVRAAPGGRGAQVVSFAAFNGKYTLSGTINAQNLVERVETLLPNGLLGDTAFESIFSDYRDFGGVKYPMRIQQRQAGFPTLDVTLSSVQPNTAAATALTAPARGGGPGGAAGGGSAARVQGKELAPGFWALEAGVPISFLIEFRDHVVIIEAPGNDERTEAVLAEVKRLTPGKPVRYVVNTHHHSDHSGGLRAMVAEGMTIVTHNLNKPYYEKILRNRATVAPDKLARAPMAPKIEVTGEKRVLTDGTRSIELHHVRGNLHDEALLMVYLPKERMLIQADAFAPRPPDAKPLPSSPYTVNLLENIQRLKLDVDQMVHVHGGMDPFSKLVEVANRRGTN
jgi:glyoxylase-like metal-dependent hydrolase (beta-lactamase superfamily II)